MTYYYGMGDDIDTGRQGDTSQFSQATDTKLCFPVNDFAKSYSINLQKELNKILKIQGKPLVRIDGAWDQPTAATLAEITPAAKISPDIGACFNLTQRVVRVWQMVRDMAAAAAAGASAASAAPAGEAVPWPTPATPVVVSTPEGAVITTPGAAVAAITGGSSSKGLFVVGALALILLLFRKGGG